ncbi:MAG: hypothetical protein LBK04_05215 [Clostridiales Family XIII bacterium]|jgi:hypothetical protein|nr:hypothetical protein [Clostridiales Family XIII bacterium]
MDLDSLLSLLDIDSPDDLVYFEQFAELAENDEDIPPEILQALFLGVDQEAFVGVVEGYFDELLRAVPDGEIDLYTLIQAIRAYLTGIIRSEEGEAFAESFTEEFLKFKSWYKDEARVVCRNNANGAESDQSLMEALTNSLLQGMTDDDYTFDFSETLDYEIDEYIVPVSKLRDDYDEFDEDDDYDDYGDYEERYSAGESYREFDEDRDEVFGSFGNEDDGNYFDDDY